MATTKSAASKSASAKSGTSRSAAAAKTSTTRSGASKTTAVKSGTSRSAAKSTNTKATASKSAKATYKPGEETQKDITLFVKDSRGKTLGEINVPAGHRVPPTRTKKAESYAVKK